jgi:tripartite-type tricarboxylate transporter receptor subunit TctC
MRKVLCLLVVLLDGIAHGAAFAQTYPSRSIRLVVPFAPGGPADFLGRVIGQKLGEAVGQQIVIDNRPGANTIIGAQAAARAEPDGYTLLMAIDGTLVMNPFLYSKLPYDPFRDFEPISLIAFVPSAFVANNGVPAETLPELIAQEKAKPGTYLIGSNTPTTQVGIELLNVLAGIKFSIVPYKGGSTQVTGLLGGRYPDWGGQLQRRFAALPRTPVEGPCGDDAGTLVSRTGDPNHPRDLSSL